MDIRVAVIGAGIMGADHARILARDLSGATLQVVCDAAKARAHSVADELGAIDAATDAEATILRPDVDAVLIASPDDTHAALTMTAIRAGKPVLCEKPLATTPEACLEIIACEVQGGRRLVQTGFMRRFDPSYREMKAALSDGVIGNALMMHNFHRNMQAPDWLTGDMAIANSASHEFDIARHVLGTEYRSISTFESRSASAVPPVFMVLETTEGQIVNVEVNNNAAYGYDVRGEVVGEQGSVFLNTPVHTVHNTNLHESTRYAADWRPRFAEAYRLQNRAWLDSVDSGSAAPEAATAWDGYCATAVAAAGIQSLQTGSRVMISLQEKPDLYR